MNLLRPVLPLAIFSAVVVSHAQPTVPTLSQSLPDQTLVVSGRSASLNLANYFILPGVNGQVVQFDTVAGKFNAELLAGAAPNTVANFMSYVTGNAYAATVIHRSVALSGMSNRIIQGGGYDTQFNAIAHQPPIALEYNLPNDRGTLAMARMSDPNSATNQWFFNVDDNTSLLGTGNGGGYAVFARVLGTGMNVVDAIAALPTYGVGSFPAVPLRDVQPGQTGVTVANEIVVNAITPVTVYPTGSAAGSLMGFSGSLASGGSAVVTAVISGSILSLSPAASGNTALTISATDTNGNTVASTLAISVVPAPVFTTQPGSLTVTAGENATFSAAATGRTPPVLQWQLNGVNLSGATDTSLTINHAQCADAGLYTATATCDVSGTSAPAILGLSTTNEVIGAGTLMQPTHILHPNGNYFDQVLLTGAAETVTAIPGRVTRTSYIDLNDDIVQVEFSGAGTLSIVLDSFSGPAAPLSYSQPTVRYTKGHAELVIAGADETTNVSVFTVGRATAFDPTGTYNILQPISATNDPANNGSPLFQGHATTAYHGIAEIAFIAISSANGKFGGVRTANARYSATNGYAGVYAPGVQFVGPVFVENISAFDAATPVLIVGSCPNARITGGDLLQPNGQPMQVSGLTQLRFTAGSDSNGTVLPAQTSRVVLLQNGENVTGPLVVYQ